ncbi:extracellular solute-binding protein [Streptomyces griseoviridis]|jgi:raffinose/stachyose/melibiose transport system substrate-binding protein|uniref:ABC transporter substrate-binding protein n=3 Tax=Streptomyces TaxID=1883 RepID=A0A918LHI9_STRGD|nr:MULTISPECIES: extracellular solute-binding protein [Streptomyces]MDP9680583.1 raffinose/stachyose/melibiose transport system substrate-binding protein [Streptomyces griseoviridis]GGS48607.1 ABC transporter substrate-binding protein [Streptomyces niveoruber]GGT08019.1 ABC transporter substrate-binding protein [Streptomyces griseoviridis]GGU49438.1 ABC transporter substrate-binding protein [Streptomyces daghestanicus]GHI28889.1 ABC transporter substrate-binding protein [Streptomyces daghestan
MGDPALSRRGFLAASAAAGLGMTALSGCGGDSDEGSSGITTVEWWNISTTQPTKDVWAALAKKFEAQNPKVKIKIVQLENDAYKSKMTALIASGKLPDIFHTWGGGVLRQQVDAGLVEDLTDRTKEWADGLLPVAKEPYLLDGRLYGIPFDSGMVGFWYNKALFERAGVSTPPTTWNGFLDTVEALKAKNITPIALAGKEKWPGMYYWAYLAMRVGGAEAVQKAAEDKDFTGPAFVRAGQLLKELAGLQPFQKGFLGAAYSDPNGQAAAVGNGKAAMELMGQWAPVVEADAGKGLGDDLGFFPFPAVEGGKGSLTEVFGGANGHALRRDAPQAAVDFLRFFASEATDRELVTKTGVLPVVTAAESALTDPNLTAVQKQLKAATGFQLYLDQAYAPAVGQEVNDSVAALVAGSKSPEQVAESITKTAKEEQ